MDEKKVMKYYYSFYDVSKELTDKQFRLFNMAIFEVMFFEKHINHVEFKDVMLVVVWKSIKHSLKSSLDGYCGKKKIDYDTLFTPLAKGAEESKIPLTNNVNDNVNDNVKDNVKDNVVMELSTTLLSGIKVSEYLLNKILINKPNFKNPNLQTWSKDIDLAIRLDNRTERELIGCIDWIYTDKGSFWIPNILSAKKLREKFDTMEAQMINKKQESDTIVDKLYGNGMSAQDAIKEMEKRYES